MPAALLDAAERPPASELLQAQVEMATLSATTRALESSKRFIVQPSVSVMMLVESSVTLTRRLVQQNDPARSAL